MKLLQSSTIAPCMEREPRMHVCADFMKVLLLSFVLLPHTTTENYDCINASLGMLHKVKHL